MKIQDRPLLIKLDTAYKIILASCFCFCIHLNVGEFYVKATF